MDPEDKPPVPLTAFLLKGLRIPSCNDGVVFVVVSLKDQVSCFFLRGGSCSWHFWWKSHQLELLTTPKEICWIFVRYKARVAERQDTMQLLQVVASQLRSFVLMNAAKDVWEALMKGIKPWFMSYTDGRKISTISVFEFEEWYILISLLLGCD